MPRTPYGQRHVAARPKASPAGPKVEAPSRLRRDRIDAAGAVTLRHDEAGRDTGMRFAVTNVTDQPVKASFEDGSIGFVLTAADGTVYDSRYISNHASAYV